jgi:hypothetical protein
MIAFFGIGMCKKNKKKMKNIYINFFGMKICKYIFLGYWILGLNLYYFHSLESDDEIKCV